MLDEFKFKALFEQPNGMKVWKESKVNFIVDLSTFGFIQKTEWLQAVGKKDINNKEIFEGDVFKFEYLEESHKPIQLIGIFVYGEDLSFEINVYNSEKYTVLHYVNNGIFRKFEIIGNIKETPDIIEKFMEEVIYGEDGL